MSGAVWVLFPCFSVSTITISTSHTCAHLVPSGKLSQLIISMVQRPVSSVLRVFEAVHTKHTGGVQPTVSARVSRFTHFEHLEFDDKTQKAFKVRNTLPHCAGGLLRDESCWSTWKLKISFLKFFCFISSPLRAPHCKETSPTDWRNTWMDRILSIHCLCVW